MTFQILPSDAKTIILSTLDKIYTDKTTLVIVFLLLILLTWFAISFFMNFDDHAWKMLTFMWMIFIFFSIFVLIQKDIIHIDLLEIWNKMLILLK